MLEIYLRILSCRDRGKAPMQKEKAPQKKNALSTSTSPVAKKKKGDSSSSSSRELVTLEDFQIQIHSPSERVTFGKLIARGIESTRFPSKSVLIELGLYDGLKCLFDNIGWGKFLDDTIEDRKTYLPVVVEMLSTMDTESPYGYSPVSFQLFNERHEVSIEWINECFGVPDGGDWCEKGHFRSSSLWTYLTSDGTNTHGTKPGGDMFKAGEKKSNQVINPVLRMALKIISHSTVARKENTSMRDVDLFILEGMLEKKKKIAFGHVFLSQVFKLVHGSIGKVTTGGMLTPIATKLNLNLRGVPCPLSLPYVDDLYLLDFTKLKDMHFLVSSKPPFRYMIGPKVEFPLPNATLVEVKDIHDQRNMRMDLPTHMMVMQRKIINFGENEEQVCHEEEGENEQEGEGSHSTYGNVSEERVGSLEDRMTSMEHGLSTLNTTIDRRLNNMGVEMERSITSLGTQVTNIAKILERFQGFQRDQGQERPGPPPS